MNDVIGSATIHNAPLVTTKTLLAGIGITSVLACLVEVSRGDLAALADCMLPLFVLVATLSALALVLVSRNVAPGYGTAILAGASAFLGTLAYQQGAFGPVRMAPAWPVYAALGLLIVVTSVVAWRERSTSVPGTSASPTVGRRENE